MKADRTGNTSAKFGDIAFWAGIVALILASYWWRLRVLDIFPFSYDEGIHLILGQLWAAGFTPYEEIFVSYPPAFLWSLGIPWRIFSQAGALQLVMATYALVGVLSVVYLGTVYDSCLAGLAAGVIVSFTPAYFIPSFSIMTEVPSISFAVAAVALAEKYRRGGGWLWVLLAGMALAYGLSLKILPYYAVPLVALMVASRHIRLNSRAGLTGKDGSSALVFGRDAAVLLVGFLAIFLAPLALFDVAALYDQVVGMRLASREVELNPFESNNDMIIEFLFGSPGLVALALYGLIFVVARNLPQYWVMALWLGLVWVSMVLLVPLRDKHLPIFIPVVALYAGFAINHMVLFLGQVSKQPVTLRTVSMTLTILLVLAAVLWNVPRATAENNGQSLDINENEERQAAISFIDQIALPDDCVIADNPVFLYQTGRLPPPELSETSQTRVDTGYLTLQDVIESVQTHRCHVVAVVTPRFGESIPGLPDWLAENYLALHAQSETFVYFARKGADDTYVPLDNGDFGGLVQLYGVHLSDQPWHPQHKGYVSLFWRLESPIKESIIQKIELRDAASHTQVYQKVRSPFEGQFDTTRWHINDQVKDTFRLDLPGNLPAGTYHIYLSLCLADMGTCLAVNRQQQTSLKIGQVTVQPALGD